MESFSYSILSYAVGWKVTERRGASAQASVKQRNKPVYLPYYDITWPNVSVTKVNLGYISLGIWYLSGQ